MTTLKQQVANRQKFVERIIEFVRLLLNEKSETLKYEEHSAHTYSHRRLMFEKFTFEDEGTFTMFGGEQVTVWYDGFKVFSVKWHDLKECEVLEWDTDLPCPDWQTPLKKLMRLGPKRIVAKIDKIENKSKKENKNAMQQVKAQMDLEAEAARLHIDGRRIAPAF